MRACARAIIIKDGNILLMKRLKMGKQYYTLLGGSVENGETADQTAIREVEEESTLKIANPRLTFIEEAEKPYGTQFVYLCDYISGDPVLPDDSEEAFWTIPDKNTYEPVWFALDKLQDTEFVSPLLKEAILMGVKHGWPTEPYKFSSKHSERLS